MTLCHCLVLTCRGGSGSETMRFVFATVLFFFLIAETVYGVLSKSTVQPSMVRLQKNLVLA